MGYTFKIGELNEREETYEDEDDYGNEIIKHYTSYDVESMELDEAPEFPNDEMTAKSNSRSPSYSAWSNFCKDAGLYHVFYNSQGHLYGSHPGYIDIDQQMINEVEASVKVLQAKSTKPPGFEGFPKYDPILGDHVTPDEGRYDYTLARAMWLEFWIKWAYNNCERPVIVNW